MTSPVRIVKRGIIHVLARYHRRVVYSPPGEVQGLDLSHDLRVLLPAPNPVCLDVGANAGQTIELLQRALDAPVIHAFEPSAAMVGALRARRFGNRVSVHQLALGRQVERREFRNYDRPDLSSFLPLTTGTENPFRDVPVTGTEVVQVETVDRFVAEHGLRHIDLLKIDTQGFDAEVIAGAAGLLAASRIRAVLIELNFVKLYEGQSSAADVQTTLLSAGLAPVGLYEVVRQDHAIAWCTALFARRDHESREPQQS
jgi:FkbM family methyltransferase